MKRLFLFFPFIQVFAVEFENPHNRVSGDSIVEFTIFGERCSGTNFLEYLVKQNIINVPCTQIFGDKHFTPWMNVSDFPFLFQENGGFLEGSEHCLGIFIVRNVYDWIRSFYRRPHYADSSLTGMGFLNFMTNTWAVKDFGPACQVDNLNPYTGRPFKNIFELRKFKIMNLLLIGKHMKNFVFVRYEDLQAEPEQFIGYISRKYHLMAKREFEPVTKQKGYRNKKFKKKTYNNFEKEELQFLDNTVDWDVEKIVGYTPKKLKDINTYFLWK